jgi:hypothetical protein
MFGSSKWVAGGVVISILLTSYSGSGFCSFVFRPPSSVADETFYKTAALSAAVQYVRNPFQALWANRRENRRVLDQAYQSEELSFPEYIEWLGHPLLEKLKEGQKRLATLHPALKTVAKIPYPEVLLETWAIAAEELGERFSGEKLSPSGIAGRKEQALKEKRTAILSALVDFIYLMATEDISRLASLQWINPVGRSALAYRLQMKSLVSDEIRVMEIRFFPDKGASNVRLDVGTWTAKQKTLWLGRMRLRTNDEEKLVYLDIRSVQSGNRAKRTDPWVRSSITEAWRTVWRDPPASFRIFVTGWMSRLREMEFQLNVLRLRAARSHDKSLPTYA